MNKPNEPGARRDLSGSKLPGRKKVWVPVLMIVVIIIFVILFPPW